MSIREELSALRDEKNAAFLARLVPNVPPGHVFGARMPELRKLARKCRGTGEAARFLEELPHGSLDENQLHALLLNEIRDYDDCLAALEGFLPYVDNWAVCDALRPKCFARHRTELIGEIRRWLDDEQVYTRRFGLEMLMTHYLDEAFRPEYLDWAARTRAEDYYLRMMQAWYFATALAKQYEAALPVLRERRLEPWTHNRTIRKAIESFRIPDERKAYLKTLRV
ncbi:MAG: DNA alkylation repair protein [Clostridia bacterium]